MNKSLNQQMFSSESLELHNANIYNTDVPCQLWSNKYYNCVRARVYVET
jgi:hypothetical protein